MARKISAALAAIAAGTSVFALGRWLRSRSRPAPPPPPAWDDDRVDEADLESFPASDPPPWTLGQDRD